MFLIQMLLPVTGQAARAGEEPAVGIADWLRDHSLTLVWLAVYLPQRGSPESKPVHAPHAETGR